MFSLRVGEGIEGADVGFCFLVTCLSRLTLKEAKGNIPSVWGAGFEQCTKKTHVSPTTAQYITNRILTTFYTLNIRCVLDEKRSTLVESFARRQLCRAKVRLWNCWKEWKKRKMKERKADLYRVCKRQNERAALACFFASKLLFWEKE